MTSRGREVPDNLIPPKGTWDKLSDELKVAVEIFRLEECETQATLSEIYKSIAVHGIEDKKKVQSALNYLVNLGTVNKEWYEIEDDRWTYKYTISGESKEFIREVSGPQLSNGYKLVTTEPNSMYAIYSINLLSGEHNILGVTSDKKIAQEKVDSHDEYTFIGYYDVPVFM